MAIVELTFFLSQHFPFAENPRQSASVHHPGDGQAACCAHDNGEEGMRQTCGVEVEEGHHELGSHRKKGMEYIYRKGVVSDVARPFLQSAVKSIAPGSCK